MSTSQPSPFAGSWQVLQAELPSAGISYTGTVTIQPLGAAFRLRWEISAGEYHGIGLLQDGHLWVGCGEHPASLGIALFTRQPDGASAVRWTTPAQLGQVGTGLLNAPAAGGLPQLELFLPDGSTYARWDMSMEREGTTIQAWVSRNGTPHMRCLGLPMPGGFALAGYADFTQLVILDYYFDPQGSGDLLAGWALAETGGGVERLRRMPDIVDGVPALDNR